MRSTTTVLLAAFLVLCVHECLGGNDDATMYALRDAFEAAGSLPSSWWGLSSDSCQWPRVTCTGGYVTKLDLNNNQLTNLPPEIGNLTSLMILNLGGNQLTRVPPEIGSLTSLQELDLFGNQLTRVPPEIGSLTSLQELNLWDNQLTNLPPEIWSITSLQELHLWDNQLTNLPPEIGGLTSLTALYLDNNQLTNLPPEIGGLTSLTALYLRNNQLTSLPDTIWSLPSLNQVVIEDNAQLCDYDVPVTFTGTIHASGCCSEENSKMLALRGAFRGTPSGWYGDESCEWSGVQCVGRRVRKIRLTNNRLTRVPPEIRSLTSLEWLYLDDNQLTSVPPEMGDLTLLEFLVLSNNQLTSVPNTIWSLPSLDFLDIHGNDDLCEDDVPDSFTRTTLADPCGGGGLSSGAVAGIVIASVAFVVGCIAVLVLLIRKRRGGRSGASNPAQRAEAFFELPPETP